jgi:hypothetical protein
MLISYLSIRVTHIPFNSLREMYENSNYRLALIPGSSHEDIFKLSNDPLWQKVYIERIKPFLEEYKTYGPYIAQIVLEEANTAIYINYLEMA